MLTIHNYCSLNGYITPPESIVRTAKEAAAAEAEVTIAPYANCVGSYTIDPLDGWLVRIDRHSSRTSSYYSRSGELIETIYTVRR